MSTSSTPERMTVSLWYNNKDIRLKEEPVPKPGPGEALLKIAVCGLCGSDLVEWYRLPRAPLVQGHEIGAIVESVGLGVTKVKPGDRVFVAPKIPCMECFYCKNGHYPQCTKIEERLPGGFSQYVLVSPRLLDKGLYVLPDTITLDQATLIEPLGCVVRAGRLGGVEKGRTVLVFGCGVSGLLHIRLAALKGCRIAAVDIDPERLALAGRSGAGILLDGKEDIADRLIKETGRPADVVMLCTSAMSAVKQAWNSVDKAGSVVFFAVPGPDKKVEIPINRFWTKEMRILTSYYCGPPDLKEAMELISSGDLAVEDLITHRIALEKIGDAFKLMTGGGKAVKIIIQPNGPISLLSG